MTNTKRLAQRRGLITGAASGIDAASAWLFAAEGMVKKMDGPLSRRPGGRLWRSSV
ncbi:MAG: hypothetical protein ACQEQT_08315 [Chloroflexota bacterium]